ncbi:zearalenone hydrolase [Stachybotrys elegans]|uniref:Zearalenone hydrolase n=1 Tax=Stachybotrys elegans TaxID=80388 RepID=A0A8K0STV1_9HYPO|nr:zearalenone hydrolase [Stachybotrys elegans]
MDSSTSHHTLTSNAHNHDSANMRKTGIITTQHNIKCYYEQEGSGPHIVLIPDGFGDCHEFDKAVSLIADKGFTVTTFDMPGMSRSRDAPPETYQDVTSARLAEYVIGITDALGIKEAAFWGCSSGGGIVLNILKAFPDRVRNAMPHEVPFYEAKSLSEFRAMSDEEIVEKISHLTFVFLGADPKAWEALGKDCHERLKRNYVTWARGYTGTLTHTIPTTAEDILKKPIDWSVGKATPTIGTLVSENVEMGKSMGIEVKYISGSHFPSVDCPEEFAQYVVDTCRKYTTV